MDVGVLTLEEGRTLLQLLKRLLPAEGVQETKGRGGWSALMGVERGALDELVCFVAAFEALLQPGVAAGYDLAGAVGFLTLRTHVQRIAMDFHTQVGGAGGRGGQVKEKIMSDPPMGCIALCMACHSNEQDTLLGMGGAGGEGVGACNSGAVPPDMCERWLDFSPGLWIKSTARLRTLCEMIARARFQRRREPMDAALWYVLARKTRQLSALFKASNEDKVAAFLLRDFENDEAARTSACKNAFALLAKHQVVGALAFFVLARRLDNALNLLVMNMGEIHLAVLVVRLAALSPQQETHLVGELLQQTVLPLAEARRDRGLLHMCYCLLSRPAAAAGL